MKTKITIITAFLFLGINTSFGQWVELQSNTSFGVPKLDCVDGLNCFLGSSNGVVKKTTDGGANWVSVNVSGTNAVSFLKMFSPDTCYVFDTDFFRTTDGGQNWTQVPFLSGRPMFFLNSSIGFGKGFSSSTLRDFYKTTDKGDTWTLISSIPNESDGIAGMFFLDEMTGFVTAGNNTTDKVFIYKTIDGGGNWIKVFEKTTVLQFFQDFIMASNQIGFACGFDGLLVKTIDGGDSWTELNHPFTSLTNLNLKSLDFINSSSGYVVGTQNVIMKTIDSGVTWTDESYPMGIMNEVSVATLDTVYIATGQNVVLKNSNADLILNIQESGIDIGKVYPNPAHEILNVEILKTDANIIIMDVTGKEILTQKLSNKEINSIELSELKYGIYFYKIISQNNVITTGKFSKN